MLDCNCELATRKCQEPRRYAPGKQPTDDTRMSIPRMYLPGILLYLYTVYVDIYFSKLVTIQRFCR